MRLPKTIRFDASDTHVFERAAEPDEWAVTGTFVFAGAELEKLSGKPRLAFASGFLGTASFGWSTFVSVAEIGEDQYQGVISALADYLMLQFGAPDRAAAKQAAAEEVAFAVSLCEHPPNTILSVSREIGDQGIIERFGVFERQRKSHKTTVWEIVEDDDGA